MREIHISGGSWENSQILPGKKIRRDTHDDAVPEEVFQLLEAAISLCPNLKYVVLEQLGIALKTEASRTSFQQDFDKMSSIVQAHNPIGEPNNAFLPSSSFQLEKPLEAPTLHSQQIELSNILETATDFQNAQQRLAHSSLANSDWKVEKWTPYMVETVMHIAQKWKGGW